VISDVCDRGDCETCWEHELDACGHECHSDPLDGQAQDPAAKASALVASRGGARRTSPSRSAGRPGPAVSAAGPGTSSSPLPLSSPTDSAPCVAAAGILSPAGGVVDADAMPSAGSRTWTITLPAGLKLMSLNGREHWAERARRTEALKKAAWALALQAKIPPLGRVAVVAEYQPPTVRRRRDAENTPAPSAKACLDGIVAAGVLEDDECPRYVTGIFCTIGEPYPKGRLVLHLTEVTA